MPSRIDNRTLIPIEMVAAILTFGVSITAVGAFWVSRVDDRLSRIESKLGIAVNETTLLPQAEAHERRPHELKAH